MKNEVEAYLERPKRYENVDGTGEMFFGLMFLGFATAAGLEGLLRAGSPRWEHAITVYAGLIPAVGLGYWLRRFVKKHWTWRRTGYVVYRRGAKWGIRIAAGALVAAALAWFFAFVERHTGPGLSRAGSYSLYPAVYAFWVLLTSREHLWKWLLVLVMVLGLVGIGLPVQGDFERVAWQMFLFLGLVWIGSGVGTLSLYIRHTQPAESQTQ